MRCFAAVLVWLFAVLPAFCHGKTPMVLFDSLNKDLGTIVQGEPAGCEFVFSNKGDAPLEIVGVRST